MIVKLNLIEHHDSQQMLLALTMRALSPSSKRCSLGLPGLQLKVAVEADDVFNPTVNDAI